MMTKILLALGVVAALILLRGVGIGKASPKDARSLVAGGALLLDVRTTSEFAAGHIAGAQNIPVHTLEDRIAGLSADERRPVVVYCRSGARSARAARILRSAGFTDVHDLGAMSRW